MPARLYLVRGLLPLLLLLPPAVASRGQPVSGSPAALSPAQAQALAGRALAAELRASQDASHPMRYRLRQSSPRLTYDQRDR